MNDKNKDHFENESNNAFENKLFRKNAFKEENNLLPKSLLKDLIEDGSSSDSLVDSPMQEKDSFYPKNFDSFREALENQATNAFSNFTPEESKLRASTFNEVDNARKSFKFAENFGANTSNKLFKVQSYNEYQNFSRPKINNLPNMNNINNLNTNNSNNLNNLNNNNFNNNNNVNYFNVESRNFCDEPQQGFMGKMPTMQSKQMNSNNNNPNMQGAKVNSFNALSRASPINQNNYSNNFFCNIGPQKPMNNMRFNPMPGRSNFPQQSNPNTNFNCPGCMGGNPNCFGNNCFSDLTPNNYAECNMGKKTFNQICLCPNCDDSAYLDENSCGYYPQNMSNGTNNLNNFGGNCINSNANMLSTPYSHGNYMNFGLQQQQFEKNNLSQCRTYCNMNVSHPNIGLGTDEQKMLHQAKTISFNNQFHHQRFYNNNPIPNSIGNQNQQKLMGHVNNNSMNFNNNPNMHNPNNYNSYNLNQLGNNMNNLNLHDNLGNNETFRGTGNMSKKGYSANNLIEKLKQKDPNNNMAYGQQQENYNMQMCFNNNIDSFVYEGNNNNQNNLNYNQGNQINNNDNNFNFQNQFENNNNNNNNLNRGKNLMQKKHMGNANMHENFNENSINMNFNKNTGNNHNKNSIQKKNSLNKINNAGNNTSTKTSANSLNSRDNINSSFTSASSQVNSQFEILDDENFDNFIERVGENLKYLIKNQKGSRSMQKFLDKIYPEHVNLLLARISGDLKEIMTDPYGNYFIQKLIQCSSSNQRMTILNTIYKDFIEIAMDSSGTHALQSLIEIMNLKEEEELIKSILNEDNILKLSINSNGTHIIQKIISCFDEENRSKVNNCVINNFSKLCMNANGICVIKRFINANKDLNLRTQLIRKFEKDCIEIVQDPFGNYAIQYAIDTFGYDSCKNIVNEICVNILSLSMQKFSSNVVEKCIENCDDETLKNLKEEIFNPVSFIALLKNKYGNFVLQRLLGKIKVDEKPRLKDVLIKSSNMCGTKEKTKLNQLMNFCK